LAISRFLARRVQFLELNEEAEKLNGAEQSTANMLNNKRTDAILDIDSDDMDEDDSGFE